MAIVFASTRAEKLPDVAGTQWRNGLAAGLDDRRDGALQPPLLLVGLLSAIVMISAMAFHYRSAGWRRCDTGVVQPNTPVLG